MDCVFDTPLHAGGGCIFDDPAGILDRIVSLTVSDPDGNPLISMSGLSWAWFDEPDAGLLVAPTDQGDTETTDLAGLLEIPLVGSALTEGQVGTLVLRSDDGSYYGVYNLQVGANGTFIFYSPSNPQGCIFADPQEFVTRVAQGGGAGPWVWPHHKEDEEIVMLVIHKFMELVNG
jgi:hypothetical protein